MKCVLDVGGGGPAIPIPEYYDGWVRHRLDIDPGMEPEVLLDARELLTLPGGTYDAVYCSHNLEHYHRHDAAKVVRGFAHVLKPDGFADIRVPDIGAVMKTVVSKGLDIEDALYSVEGVGPIRVRDILYGYGPEVERSGNDFFAHKTGFTVKSLTAFLCENGFPHVAAGPMELEALAVGFKRPPNDELRKFFNLP